LGNIIAMEIISTKAFVTFIRKRGISRWNLERQIYWWNNGYIRRRAKVL